MKLFTDEQREQMLSHGRINAEYIAKDGKTEDFKPVVKLFTPWAASTWLLSELDPNEPDVAFGLCDLGMGCPELGKVSLAEIEAVTGPFGLKIERDLHFTATRSLGDYATEARAHGYIVD